MSEFDERKKSAQQCELKKTRPIKQYAESFSLDQVANDVNARREKKICGGKIGKRKSEWNNIDTSQSLLLDTDHQTSSFLLYKRLLVVVCNNECS